MTNDDERMDQDDPQLKALFDATAEEPSREVLDRLARHAATVPDRAPVGVLGWVRTRWWSPLVLAAATLTVVAGAWLVLRSPETPDGAPVAATTPAPAEAPLPDDDAFAFDDATQADMESAVVMLDATPLDEALADDDLDPLAALDVGQPVDGLGLFDVLIAPDGDDEFDRWAAALEAQASTRGF
jgi:hypothetical protein